LFDARFYGHEQPTTKYMGGVVNLPNRVRPDSGDMLKINSAHF